jgi:transcriptional regulator with XRE-family HTH domain
MVSENFGARVTQARKAAGFTVRQLATRMSVKPSTIENWEAGRSEPRANKLVMLAGVLGIPVLWLLDGEMPDGVNFDVNISETTVPARKLERAIALQSELAALLQEVAADVSRLQRDIDRTAAEADGEEHDAAA